MKIYYVTTNIGKVNLLRSFTDERTEVVQVSLELPEPRSNDVQVIAQEKIVYAYTQLQQPVVVMDAGFYVFSLNGFPRAFVNFALETIGIEGILRLVRGKDRHCEFRECLAYIDDEIQKPQYFAGHFRGKLSEEPLGTLKEHAWSDLWRIFIPEGHELTLAQMTRQEYLSWIQTHAPDRLFAGWHRTHRSMNNAASDRFCGVPRSVIPDIKQADNFLNLLSTHSCGSGNV